MDLLEVRGLSKRYKGFSLEDISFSIPPGFIMGYIGQNGAGKTTTLNAITHLTRADRGEVFLDGRSFYEDPAGYRGESGSVGDGFHFPVDMTQGDIKKILKSFYPRFDGQQYETYMEKWDLPKKMKLKKYSRGMKVKLMFAAALSKDTKLLILDEATNGLDPVVRREILGLLQDYIADGRKSVLFSTHIMEDLQNIADYIFFIDQGKKILFDTKDELVDNFLLVKGGLENLQPELERVLIGIERKEYGFLALYDTRREGILPAGLTVEKPSIDEIVVHIIDAKTKSF
ncbi:MAG: ABC transporter ATP-binding protein [Lachnospiraceae bacterium]|nr:ABC transporter ATP-binding protein [Lachnospiraceae bacterium]